MNKDERRVYNREKMRFYRAKKREGRYLEKGRCPLCRMLLDPKYEIFHKGCAWYERKIHANLDISSEKIDNRQNA